MNATSVPASGDRHLPAPASAPLTRGERAGSMFVLGLMVVGCQVLWIGIPAGGMWLASKLTDSFGAHQPLALALILPGMFVTAMGLAWLNELYLRMRRTPQPVGRPTAFRRARGGPLEPLMVASFVIALTALFAWFFLLAENPGSGVFGW